MKMKRDFILLASLADLRTHPKVENPSEGENQDHVSVLSGQHFDSGHRCFLRRILSSDVFLKLG